MADGEQNTNQSYSVKTTLGFSGAHTIWLVCNGCGAVCTEETEALHNEFHEQLVAVQGLGVETNKAVNAMHHDIQDVANHVGVYIRKE